MVDNEMMPGGDITVNSDIIVIDDSKVILTALKDILGGIYNVRAAQSAKEAYDLMQEKIPDLILLDLEMPEINGIAFFESIKTNPEWRNIPVIFLTSIDDRKKEETALGLGAAEYILKPIVAEILLKRVHFHLELAIYRRSLEKLVSSRTEDLLKTQEELQRAVNTAKAALRDKTTFLANMSNEIRTPMNNIMGISEAALEGDISPEMRGYFTGINDSTRVLLRVINDILDLSKIEAGKMEMENVSFSTESVIRNCQMMVSNQIEDKGLKLDIHIDNSLKEKQLLGDPVRLYQSILNLLSNAIKFTEKGTISFSVKQIGSGNEFAPLRFDIKDTGIGIPEEQLESIFEPFVQVGKEHSKVDAGTGLGLPITKSIVELMGGTLTVESTLGEGSTFSIEIKLPITKEDSLFDDVFGEALSENSDQPVFNGEVLVCEDNLMNQQVIREHLKRVGLESVIAENGLEGLRIVIDRMKKEKKPFDLILMDTQMPVMDGFEATARINALGTGTPIVAMVANVMVKDLEDYIRNGFLDCIGKPFQTWDLWRCLLSFLMPVKSSGITSAESTEQLQDDIDDTGPDNKKRILIVDDEKSNIIALAHFLRDEFSVFVIRDSREAAEMAANHMPNIILLDILMPGMDGYEVMTALKKNKKTKNIPVIFISGLTSPEAMMKGLSHGASDYITKPFEPSVVKTKIKRLLLKHELTN